MWPTFFLKGLCFILVLCLEKDFSFFNVSFLYGCLHEWCSFLVFVTVLRIWCSQVIVLICLWDSYFLLCRAFLSSGFKEDTVTLPLLELRLEDALKNLLLSFDCCWKRKAICIKINVLKEMGMKKERMTKSQCRRQRMMLLLHRLFWNLLSSVSFSSR